MFAERDVLQDTLLTVGRLVTGTVVGVIPGILIGMTMGLFRWVGVVFRAPVAAGQRTKGFRLPR